MHLNLNHSLFSHYRFVSFISEHPRSVCQKSTWTWILMLKWSVWSQVFGGAVAGVYWACPPSFILCWFECLSVFLRCTRCHIEQAQQVCRTPFLWLCSTDVSGSITWPCLTWPYTHFHHVCCGNTLLSVSILFHLILMQYSFMNKLK